MSFAKTTKDVDALPFLARLTGSMKEVEVGKKATCTAYFVTLGNEAKWKEYIASLGDPGKLPAWLGSYLENPKVKCAAEVEEMTSNRR